MLKDEAPLSSPPSVRDSAAVKAKLGHARPRGIKLWLKRALWLVLLGALIGGFMVWRRRQSAEPQEEYRTAAVERGDLEATVTATGSLKGLDTVEVGAEISGIVKSVSADFNDQVEAGQVLCEIDPAQLAASRNQTQAQLVAAQAELGNRKATAEEARLTAQRSQALFAEGLISQQQLEAAVAAAQRADAAVKAAAAQLIVSRENLSSAQTKLDKTKIIAPMDGVVLSRTVEVGQTVAASLQSPVLFTLARDLRRMELTVAIDEADIGQVKAGQKASFVVDAFPDRTFPAELKEIHNIAITQDNVVSYEAILTVHNDDLALRPGMTATATIVTEARRGVLLVPNAALRFKPPSDDFGGPRFPGMRRSRPNGSAEPGGSARPGGSAQPGGAEGPRGGKGATVWVLDNGAPAAAFFLPGLTDGEHTELVKSRRLTEGSQVIIDMVKRKD